MSTTQRDELRRLAEVLRQAEKDYWERVSRYLLLAAPGCGEPGNRPTRVMDLAAIREFEAAELSRRNAADAFHALLRRRARAMQE